MKTSAPVEIYAYRRNKWMASFELGSPHTTDTKLIQYLIDTEMAFESSLRNRYP